jgi:hypothetical protein
VDFSGSLDSSKDDFYGAEHDSEFEDEGPWEAEREEEKIDIGGTQLSLQSFMESDIEFGRWLQTIRVQCWQGERQIGHALGRYVDRNRIRRDFWMQMEAPSQELATLGFELFDRYGCLKDEFKNHTVRKGTGVWGDELDDGSFFVIEALMVKKA